MHQWSHIELRGSTVFAPNVFLYQMANTITVQVHSHRPSDRASFHSETWCSIKMRWSFKPKPTECDVVHTLICTQDYEILYEMAICCPWFISYLQLLSPSLKLTYHWMDAFSILSNVCWKHPPKSALALQRSFTVMCPLKLPWEVQFNWLRIT